MVMKVGIDAIGFYSPRYYLELATLAKVRGIDVDKFYHGLGQIRMSVVPPGEDVVTMAASSAHHILRDEDLRSIDTVLFATESGIDHSKSAGIYVHRLLGLSPYCRIIELKQACYSGTFGLQIAMNMLQQDPNRKILLIASDIARYGLNTSGESSQGAGAIALLLSANPRLLAIEPESGFYTEDVMDFWRPIYMDVALVNGKYSCDLYLRVLEKVWQRYTVLSGRTFSEHDYFCYHVAVPKLVEKAHSRLAKLNGYPEYNKEHIEYSLNYSREVGNCYAAALGLSVLSLLETSNKDLTNCRIGLYSYGSGCVGEYFSAIVQPGFANWLNANFHQQIISERKALSYAEYEYFYNFKLPVDGGLVENPIYATGPFRLMGIDDHKRIYKKIA
jgi:hydroxymethylglutaryl-CoA synthase